MIPLAALHNVDYSIGKFALVALISFFFGWCVFSVAMLFSVIFSVKSRVYMVTGAVLFIMYALNIVAAFVENLVNLKYASFFSYYNYNDALHRNTLDTTGILVFFTVAVVCTAAGAFWFRKRDIAV